MSTVIEVLPTRDIIPTVGEVISLATTHLHAYLSELGIEARPVIHFEVHTPPDVQLRVRPSAADLFRWDSKKYGWFFVDEFAGGTDAYFKVLDDYDHEYWAEELAELRPQVTLHQEAVRTYLEVGNRWSFRRSAGQFPIINITYGLIAAALAELTDGLLFSDDGGWEYKRLPCRADDFLRVYYRPEHALSEESRHWARQNQDWLRETFAK